MSASLSASASPLRRQIAAWGAAGLPAPDPLDDKRVTPNATKREHTKRELVDWPPWL